MNRYMIPYLEVMYENENDKVKRLKEEQGIIEKDEPSLF